MTKLLLNLILGLLFTACLFSDVTIEIGKEFTVKKGQTGVLSGSDLKIKMLKAGRTQRQRGGDTIFCTFDSAFGGSHREVTLDVGGTVMAGDLVVKLSKVDLTTSPKAKDPWETNSCSFIIDKTQK